MISLNHNDSVAIMLENGSTTGNASGVGSYIFNEVLSKESEIQAQIKKHEDIIHDLTVSVQMTNQEIKNNKAKIKILKDFLSK